MENFTKRPSPLRLARVAAGLRLQDIALVLDRPVCYVCRIETGGSARIDNETARRIAEAVGRPVNELFSVRSPE